LHSAGDMTERAVRLPAAVLVATTAVQPSDLSRTLPVVQTPRMESVFSNLEAASTRLPASARGSPLIICRTVHAYTSPPQLLSQVPPPMAVQVPAPQGYTAAGTGSGSSAETRSRSQHRQMSGGRLLDESTSTSPRPHRMVLAHEVRRMCSWQPATTTPREPLSVARREPCATSSGMALPQALHTSRTCAALLTARSLVAPEPLTPTIGPPRSAVSTPALAPRSVAASTPCLFKAPPFIAPSGSETRREIKLGGDGVMKGSSAQVPVPLRVTLPVRFAAQTAPGPAPRATLCAPSRRVVAAPMPLCGGAVAMGGAAAARARGAARVRSTTPLRIRHDSPVHVRDTLSQVRVVSRAGSPVRTGLAGTLVAQPLGHTSVVQQLPSVGNQHASASGPGVSEDNCVVDFVVRKARI